MTKKIYSNNLTYRSHDMGAQDSVGLLIGQNLDHAVGLVIGFGATVGGKWELPHHIIDTFGLQILLVLAHPCDLQNLRRNT